MKLDSLSPRETPEGASLLLKFAGPAPRAGAFLIDSLIRIGIFWGASIALSFAGKAGMGLFLILFFLIEWFYPVVFEVWRSGATPGKSALGIAVVLESGAPVTFAASFTRNLLRAVDFLPFGYLLGYTAMMCNGEFRRLGDLAAGTVVVHRARTRAQVEATPASEGLRVASRHALTREEQQQLAEFARRTRGMTSARVEELALLLPPLARAGGESPQDRAAALVALGNQYSGRS